MKYHTQIMSLACVLFMSTQASALDFFPQRGQFNVDVKSYRELQFGDVLRQKYDFSCGSAALASLLTYHYELPSDEQDIFTQMYENGDKARIEQQGFSLLDMKSYLMTRDLQSDGFKLDLAKLKKIGVPGITLVNFDGYMHFVVIKGINSHSVIIGDPSRGTIMLPIEKFNQYYQGIVLLVRNRADVGKLSFVQDDAFSLYTSAPIDEAIVRDSLGIYSNTLPEIGDN